MFPPLPFLSLYTYQSIGRTTAQKMTVRQEIMQRPLNQDEAEALTFYTSKSVTIQSYTGFFGALAGARRAYVTKETWRFPWLQPNLRPDLYDAAKYPKLKPGNFDPAVFPSVKIPLLSGSRATLLWNLLRYSIYPMAGHVAAVFFMVPFSSLYMPLMGDLSDPRLREMRDEIARQVASKNGRLPTQQSGQRQRVDTVAKENDMQEGSAMADVENNAAGSYDDTAEARQWPGAEQQKTTPARWPVRTAPAQTRKEEQPFDAWDDASPTGGQGVSMDTQAGQPQGSSWERLRQQEVAKKRQAPGGGNDPWNRTRGPVQTQRTPEDNFSYSKSEEDRVLAKEEAQREFDARVEQERRGGDFSKNDGDQKRW